MSPANRTPQFSSELKTAVLCAPRAVLLGLELARELDASEVEVVNDSEMVARQLQGRYKAKHAGLKPLFVETLEALRGFDR